MKFNRKNLLVLASISLVFTAPAASAASYFWSGLSAGTWNTGTNWSGNVVPTLSDNLSIRGPSNAFGGLTINFNADNSANSLNFTNTSATSVTNTTSGANRTLTLGSGGITTGIGTVQLGGTTTNQAVNILLNNAQTWNIGAGGLTVTNVVSGSSTGITKTGAGNLTFNGNTANSFTGGLNVNGGTTTLDFINLNPPTNLIAPTNPLQINSGVLNITGRNVSAATTAQTFAGTTFGEGRNTINIAKGTSATSATLNLGALTVNTGSVTAFIPTTVWTTTASTTERVFITAGGSVPSLPGSGSLFVNGLFHRTGAGAGAVRWAAVNPSGQLLAGTAIGALGATTDLSTTPHTITSANITFTTTTANTYGLLLNGDITTRSITLAANGTFTLNSIIQTQATNAVTIAPGTGASNLIIGAERNLVINMDNAAGVSISAPIADNGLGLSTVTIASTAPTGTTPGTVTFSGANTFTGRLSVVNSQLSIGTINNVSANGVLGNSALSVNLGGSGGLTGTLGYTGSTASSTKPFTLATGGTGAFDVTVTANTLTLNGAIDGSGNLTKLGAGRLTLGAANSFTGATTISAGTLRLANTGAVANSSALNFATATGNVLQIGTDTAFVASNVPTISAGFNNSGTTNIVSDRATTGAGLTHVLAGLSLDNTQINITAGSNVTSGTAAISFASVGLNSTTSGGTTTLNPTTANLLVSGNVTASSSTGTHTLALDGTSTGNSISGAITNGGRTTQNLTKASVSTSTSTWTLSGLSSTAANNYNGTTTINNGTLAITTASPSFTGGLTFGTGQESSAPTAILDLTTVNATFGGTLLVNAKSTASEIKIGSSQTLTVNGPLQIGATSANSVSITELNMTGGGTFNFNGSAFLIGGSTNSFQQVATLDLAALKAATINTSGNLRVVPTTTNTVGSHSELFLPAPAVADTVVTTTITANGAKGICVGNGASYSTGGFSGLNLFRLGTGLTTLNAGMINIASNEDAGSLRDIGQMVYGQAAGDLKIRGANGTDAMTSINLGVSATVTSTATLNDVLFDVSGHDADILVTTLNVGNQGRSINQTYQFKFGAGNQASMASTLAATNVNIGFRPGAVSTTSVMTSKVDLSGGTVTFGNVGATGTGVDIGSSTYDQVGAASNVAQLNVSGGNVTIHNSTSMGAAVRLGTNVAAGGGTVTASMNLSGGTTTLGGDIIRGATVPRTTSTVRVNGGTLDMAGNDIGTLAEPLTLAAESGTLQNIATINGTGNLTKTTIGTLTLDGNNTYTTDTVISLGTLALADNAQLKFVLGTSGVNNQISGTGTATLNGDFVIDTTAADGLTSGSWTLENVTTLTGAYGANFTVSGFTDIGSNKWRKANGPDKFYTFNETTGVLTLATRFLTWATDKGLVEGVNAAMTDNPDGDGMNNFAEYAVDGNPLSSADNPKIVGKITTIGGNRVFTLTLPVRGTAPTPTFSASSGDQLSAQIEGLYYRIEGTADLSSFADNITEVTGGDQTPILVGLPALTIGLPPGWSYRTFRVPGTVPTVPHAFLRAKISETP